MKLNRFDDYIFNLILEKVANDEMILVLSDKLEKIIKRIDHDIARKLVSSNNNIDEKFKVTLLDIDDKPENFDKFIFTQSPKAYDTINKYVKDTMGNENDYSIDELNQLVSTYKNMAFFPVWDKNRVPGRIGRVINTLYPNKYTDKDLESFINLVKSERTKELGIFVEVEGEDIVKYYDSRMYDHRGAGSGLFGSCMSSSRCSPYIGFYAKNDVKLLLLMSNDEPNKISGRALIWNISLIDNVEVDRVFMDRVYTINNHDVQKFKDYAIKRDWLYKKNQDRFSTTEIVDPLNGNVGRFILTVKNIKKYKAYPYADTLKFLDSDNKTLSNEQTDADNYRLESTIGGYVNDSDGEMIYDEHSGTLVSNEERVWSRAEGRNIDPDFAVFSNYLDDWASTNYADQNWSYSEREDDYFPVEETVYINGDYDNSSVSIDYARIHLKECEVDGNWYEKKKVIDSDLQGYIPKENAVEVYIDIEGKFTDWRYNDGDTYIEYRTFDGDTEYYCNSLKDKFIQAIKNINWNIAVYMKKDLDKNRYFKFKDRYYIKDLEDELIGQKRIDFKKGEN